MTISSLSVHTLSSGLFCFPPSHTHEPLDILQSQSPAYNVSALNVPTALFSGGKDWLADPTDVAGLVPLINSTVIFSKEIDDYDHLGLYLGCQC